MKLKSKYLSVFLVLLLAFFALPAFAVEGEEEEPVPVEESETPTCETAQVVYLMDKTGAECQTILDLYAEGIGFGEMMKAAVIAAGLDDEETDWLDILAWHTEDDLGWGQISHAYGLAEYFSELGLTPAEILELRLTEEIGWGQIVQAQAIATLAAEMELELTFDDVLEMILAGEGWGEIRETLELPPGPPPWAGLGPVKKGDLSDHPSQTRGPGEEKQNGPPPWAGGPKNNGDDDEEEVEAPEEPEETGETDATTPDEARPANGHGNRPDNPGNGNGNGNGNGGRPDNPGNGNGSGGRPDNPGNGSGSSGRPDNPGGGNGKGKGGGG